MWSAGARVTLALAAALGLVLADAAHPVDNAAAQPTSFAPASATPSSGSGAPTGSSLTVRPSRIIVPADQIARSQSFTLVNRGTSAVEVVIRTTGFAADRAGRIRLGLGNAPSAATWTTVTPDRLRLPAGATGHVRLRLAVPGVAGPGEHDVAVLFSVPAARLHGRITVGEAIGVPVYVTVPGPVVDSIQVEHLAVEPAFSLRGRPITFTATLRNTGNVHRDFLDKRRIGVQVGGRTVPFAGFTLLRGASRDLRTRWTDPPLMCVCRASLTVPSREGTDQTATARVVILPLQLLVPATALVFALLLTFALAVRRRRRPRGHPATEVNRSGIGAGRA